MSKCPSPRHMQCTAGPEPILGDCTVVHAAGVLAEKAGAVIAAHGGKVTSTTIGTNHELHRSSLITKQRQNQHKRKPAQ